MPEGVEKMAAGVERMAHGMRDMHQHTEGTQASFGRLVASFASYHALQDLFTKKLSGVSPLLKGMEIAYNTIGRSQSDIREAYRSQKKEIKRLFLAGKLNSQEFTEQLTTLKSHIPLMQAQVNLIGYLNTLSGVQKVTYGLILASLARAAVLSHDLNQDLIEANASLSHRLELMSKTLTVQSESGVAFGLATDAARELVRYSFDLEGSFAQQVKTVSMLHDGIGLSVHLAGELAVVYERQLGTSLTHVADKLSNIVNDTSLAADEAGRLAVNLGRAVGAMREGIKADMTSVLGVVSRYESALKEVGGKFGGFEELLTKLTTTQGLMGAGVLGVQSPEFLASERGTEAVLERFNAYAKSMVGLTSGWERRMRLEQLADVFNISADQAAMMMKAHERLNRARLGTLTTEERFSDQMAATGKGFSRLVNALQSMMMQGLAPIIGVINKAVNALADLVTWAGKSQYVVWPVFVATISATIALTVSLANLARQMWSVTRAAIAQQLVQAGGAYAGNKIPSGKLLFDVGVGFGLRAVLTSLVTVLTNPIVLALIALGATLAAWAHFWRKSEEEKARGFHIAKMSRDRIHDTFGRTYAKMLSKDDLVGARAQLERYIGLAHKPGTRMKPEDAVEIAARYKQAAEMEGLARFGAAKLPMVGSASDEDRTRIAALKAYQQRTEELRRQQLEAARELIKQNRLKDAADRQADEERKSIKNIQRPNMYPYKLELNWPGRSYGGR